MGWSLPTKTSSGKEKLWHWHQRTSFLPCGTVVGRGEAKTWPEEKLEEVPAPFLSWFHWQRHSRAKKWQLKQQDLFLRFWGFFFISIGKAMSFKSNFLMHYNTWRTRCCLGAVLGRARSWVILVSPSSSEYSVVLWLCQTIPFHGSWLVWLRYRSTDQKWQLILQA